MTEELPKGWSATTLGQLSNFIMGQAPPGSASNFDGVGTPFVKAGEFGPIRPIIREWTTQPLKFASEDDVLICVVGATAGKINLGADCAIGRSVAAIRPNDATTSSFIYRKLQTLVDSLRGSSTGSAQGVINQGMLAEIDIDLPPLPEQHRIVAKIDTLFARSTRARNELARIPKLIERYRQAVLEAAFRGDLTEDWRKDHQPAVPKISPRHPIDGRAIELGDLPTEWVWQSIGDMCDVTGGLTKNQSRHTLPIKMPYLRVANVYANELRLDEIEEIGVTAGEADRVRLMPGDLLIVEGNGSLDQIGRVALWQDEIRECGHQNHLIKARPSAHVTAKYALYWLLSPAGRKAIEVVASSSAGLHTLSISKVKGLPIPCCSLDEMPAVVEQIESRFAILADAEGQFRRTQGMLTRLDTSILDKAFSGKLVPQDPEDEPASVLLERIWTARAEAPKPKRGRRAKG